MSNSSTVDANASSKIIKVDGNRNFKLCSNPVRNSLNGLKQQKNSFQPSQPIFKQRNAHLQANGGNKLQNVFFKRNLGKGSLNASMNFKTPNLLKGVQ